MRTDESVMDSVGHLQLAEVGICAGLLTLSMVLTKLTTSFTNLQSAESLMGLGALIEGAFVASSHDSPTRPLPQAHESCHPTRTWSFPAGSIRNRRSNRTAPLASGTHAKMNCVPCAPPAMVRVATWRHLWPTNGVMHLAAWPFLRTLTQAKPLFTWMSLEVVPGLMDGSIRILVRG